MRKFLVLLLGIILLAGATACSGQVFYKMAFYPHYWITGTVKDAADGTSAVGRTVYFFKTLNEYSGGVYAMGTVGSDHRRVTFSAFFPLWRLNSDMTRATGIM